MTEHLGFNIALNILSGHGHGDVSAYQASKGKTIAALYADGNELRFDFTDGTYITLTDDGQTCCENRYVTCDEDLAPFVGATLMSVEIREAPNIEDKYGSHEVQFMVTTTSQGQFTVATHNEHNGYYGGFWINVSSGLRAREEDET
jgi:hypothetical protein